MTNVQQEFSAFKCEDFEVLYLDNLLQGKERYRIIDVAQAVVNASREGNKPVNFRLRTEREYWTNWTALAGDGRLLIAGLDHLGYRASYMTNPTSDGFYLRLEKKPIPSDTPSQPRL